MKKRKKLYIQLKKSVAALFKMKGRTPMGFIIVHSSKVNKVIIRHYKTHAMTFSPHVVLGCNTFNGMMKYF